MRDIHWLHLFNSDWQLGFVAYLNMKVHNLRSIRSINPFIIPAIANELVMIF